MGRTNSFNRATSPSLLGEQLGHLSAEVGIIGGSGFYELLSEVEEVEFDTPFGPTSSPISIGDLAGRTIAFLARHGRGHEYPAHAVPYRANLWAMRKLGVTRIVSPCATGSLRAEIKPGDFVVCDQLIDRTSGRRDTYFDGPVVNHISLADPFCPELRAVAIESLSQADRRTHPSGTVVVVQGPRFSTRAESHWYRSMDADIVNMTQYPEAALARELGICYSAIALVTDYDSGVPGVEHIESVTMNAVFALLSTMVDTVRSVLRATVAAIPVDRACHCGEVGVEVPMEFVTP